MVVRSTPVTAQIVRDVEGLVGDITAKCSGIAVDPNGGPNQTIGVPTFSVSTVPVVNTPFITCCDNAGNYVITPTLSEHINTFKVTVT